MTAAGMDLAAPLYIGGAAQQRRSSTSERPQKERVTFIKKATHSQSSPAIGIAKVGLGYVKYAYHILFGASNPQICSARSI
jgi:hypothetical protein